LNATVVFTAYCGATYLIQVGTFGPNAVITGSISVTEAIGSACSPSSFCSGDAAGTACLACNNNGTPGRGCANSSSAIGAQLAGSGNASVSVDTLVLTASDLTGPGLCFQATGLAAVPITFGDGMLCASIGIVRLGVAFPVAGVASYPNVLNPSPIHVAGAPVNPGDIRHYQCWYRDAAVFCSPSTYNTTNGVSVSWGS
jgi:hypothetical protein